MGTKDGWGRSGSRVAKVAAALVVIAGIGCRSAPPDNRSYAARVAAARAEKDALFQRSDQPIPTERKADLLPLAYFQIDPDYNVPAVLKPSDDRTTLLVPTSTGT